MKDLGALERVLDSYPVSEIKSRWEKKGRKSSIIGEVTERGHRKEIVDFLQKHFGLTRQHSYLWRLSKGRRSLNDDPLGLQKLVSSESGKEWFYLIDMSWTVASVVDGRVEQTQVDYEWPVRIHVERDEIVVLTMIILERDPGKFIQRESTAPTDTWRVMSTSHTEEEIIAAFLAGVPGATPLDLNKGVKHLWEKDFVDSQYVKSKAAKSVTTEAMDEKLLFKATYPDKYKEVTKRPLFKTQFTWLKDPDDYVTAFTVDASAGLIRFPKFSKTVNGPSNVIREILRNN